MPYIFFLLRARIPYKLRCFFFFISYDDMFFFFTTGLPFIFQWLLSYFVEYLLFLTMGISYQALRTICTSTTVSTENSSAFRTYCIFQMIFLISYDDFFFFAHHEYFLPGVLFTTGTSFCFHINFVLFTAGIFFCLTTGISCCLPRVFICSYHALGYLGTGEKGINSW